MGRKTRRIWAPLYRRSLLGPGKSKSLQPMAARQGLVGHDPLQHFATNTAWDDALLWSVPVQEADRLIGGPQAWRMIDDTMPPKKSVMSAGVLPSIGQAGQMPVPEPLVRDDSRAAAETLPPPGRRKPQGRRPHCRTGLP